MAGSKAEVAEYLACGIRTDALDVACPLHLERSYPRARDKDYSSMPTRVWASSAHT